jgi:hypothetical protein
MPISKRPMLTHLLLNKQHGNFWLKTKTDLTINYIVLKLLGDEKHCSDLNWWKYSR